MPMDNTIATNPYKAGPGLSPPRLAGRHKEIRIIEKALNEIKGGAGVMARSPDPILALVGPRGVGKTVLLVRAVEEATSRGIHVGRVNRKILSGPQGQIVSHVFPSGEVEKILDRIKTVGGSILGSGATVSVYEAEAILRLAMLDYLSNNPLLLILDEAHHCEPEGLNMLFDIVQECMSLKLPLAFIIAGTPGLVKHLRSSEMTFAERSKFLRFNILSREEAKEALEVPAKNTGRPMDPDALQCMLDWSDNYPFFIQVIGEHSWAASESRGGKKINLEDAKAGMIEAESIRNDFYDERYDEIYDLKVNGQRIVDQAVQIAELVPTEGSEYDRGSLATKLENINDGMDEDHAVGVVDSLLDRGFLWRNHGVIEPGIPSLFDFVKHKRAKAKANPATS